MRKSTVLLLLLVSATIFVIVFPWQNLNIAVPNVSAVSARNGVGVYWDQAATNRCQNIYWGELFPWSSKTMVVYIRNEDNESLFYLLTTEQWYPANASNYIALKSDYNGSRASVGSVRKVSLTLTVSSRIYSIVDFSFDIVVSGSPYLWGDVNHDGLVDIRDIAIVAKAYGSYPGSPTWKAEADINGDGKIDLKDVAIACKNFGKKNE